MGWNPKLRTKLHGNQPTCSEKEDSQRVLNCISAIWSCDPTHLKKNRFLASVGVLILNYRTVCEKTQF